MADCFYHARCGLPELPGAGENVPVCILHSSNKDKDKSQFASAFEQHRQKAEADCSLITFPVEINFYREVVSHRFFGAHFLKRASFHEALFPHGADFSAARFDGEAGFGGAQVNETANFGSCHFASKANFASAKFLLMGPRTSNDGPENYRIDFEGAEFEGEISFLETEFHVKTTFRNARFSGDALFYETNFDETVDFTFTEFLKPADFLWSKMTNASDFVGTRFLAGGEFKGVDFRILPRLPDRVLNFDGALFTGPTLFAPLRRSSEKSKAVAPVFTGIPVCFTGVRMDPLDCVEFRSADLTNCLLLDTDLRKLAFVDVIWPKISGRLAIQAHERLGKSEPGRIERAYRELKQNYEDHHDFDRAGDFHFQEKEMVRQNPRTPPVTRFLLWLYRWISGYGESYLLPLLWLILLFALSTFAYLRFGLAPKDLRALSPHRFWDWVRAAHYSLRVMTLMKPDDLVPGPFSRGVQTLETLAGPILFGFFALALRQRMRR